MTIYTYRETGSGDKWLVQEVDEEKKNKKKKKQKKQKPKKKTGIHFIM